MFIVAIGLVVAVRGAVWAWSVDVDGGGKK